MLVARLVACSVLGVPYCCATNSSLSVTPLFVGRSRTLTNSRISNTTATTLTLLHHSHSSCFRTTTRTLLLLSSAPDSVTLGLRHQSSSPPTTTNKRNLSAQPGASHQQPAATPPHHHPPYSPESIVQWLTSKSASSPPPHIRVSFTPSGSDTNCLCVTTTTPIDHGSPGPVVRKRNQQRPEPYRLSPAESLEAATSLISSILIPENHRRRAGTNNGHADHDTPPFLLPRTPPNLPPLTIEFSSPNIAKPLHMGHLRSTVTGSFIRNVTEFAGHRCRSVCFLGDWGKQFGILHAGVVEEMKRSKHEHEHRPDSPTSGGEYGAFVRSMSLHKLLGIYVKGSGRVDTDLQFRDMADKYSAELEQHTGTPDNHDIDYANSSLLWTHTRTLTLSHLQSTYSRLSIHFDAFEAESEFCKQSPHTVQALEMLKSRGLVVTRDDGSMRVMCPPQPRRSTKRTTDETTHHDDDPQDDSNTDTATTATADSNSNRNSQVIVKTDGSSVYLLRDIACGIKRYREQEAESTRHRFVYVVDVAQSDHFRNLFTVLNNVLPTAKTFPQSSESEHANDADPPTSDPDHSPFPSSFTHVCFGRITGMSTRSGTAVLLSDVISQGTTLMHEARRLSKNARNIDDIEISEKLAISALVISILQTRRTKNYKFDWERALKAQGNTGVSVQYTVARLRSLVDKVTGVRGGDDDLLFGASGGGDREAREAHVRHHLDVIFRSGRSELVVVVAELVNFEDTFWRSYETLEPCVLVTYVFQVCDKVSRALASVKLVSEPDAEFRTAALWLFASARNVIVTTLRVVGVADLDKGF